MSWCLWFAVSDTDSPSRSDLRSPKVAVACSPCSRGPAPAARRVRRGDARLNIAWRMPKRRIWLSLVRLRVRSELAAPAFQPARASRNRRARLSDRQPALSTTTPPNVTSWASSHAEPACRFTKGEASKGSATRGCAPGPRLAGQRCSRSKLLVWSAAAIAPHSGAYCASPREGPLSDSWGLIAVRALALAGRWCMPERVLIG